MIIAIDGHAGAGKGTIARYLAQHFKLAYLDTGLLYRFVASQVLKDQIPLDNVSHIVEIAKNISLEDIQPLELRAENLGDMASQVGVLKPVRDELTILMQNFSQNPPPGFEGVILDGRDIGTVVLPQAECKLFVTATPRERAQRRAFEAKPNLSAEEKEEFINQLEKEITLRDKRDMERKHSPLICAKDAVIIDTTMLTINQACLNAASITKNCIKK